jgi:hypothetical protein
VSGPAAQAGALGRTGRLRLQRDPLGAARGLLPTAAAASVFGVPDRGAADRLLDVDAPLPPLPAAPPVPGSKEDIALLQQWQARQVLLVVSPAAVHCCDWDDWTGPRREVARLARLDTSTEVERWRSAVRVTLLHHDGYRLQLVGSASRWSPFGRATRRVLAELGG